MAGDAPGSTRAIIVETFERLQKASACENDIGERYSRLIKLLWRKPPGRGSIAEPIENTRALAAHANLSHTNDAGQPDHAMFDTSIPQPSINTFSWLDLGAVGDFAITNNEGMSGSFDDSSTDEFTGFDQSVMIPHFGWADNNMSPSGVIF